MKVCCVMSGVGPGGAERVMSTICNHLASVGHAVTLITFGAADVSFYPLHPSVGRMELDATERTGSLQQAIRHNGRLVRRIRRAIKQMTPDVVLSFVVETNILTLLAATGLHVPVVVSERTYPPMHRLGRIWQTLRRLTYSRAAALVVQTEKGREWAAASVRTRRVEVIPNPLSPSFAANGDAGSPRSREHLIAAIGRLDRDKSFDQLIMAFGSVRARFPEWRLTIAGDGEEMPSLQALVAAEAPDCVQLAGLIPEPRDLLDRSAIFVMSSRFEGFPNALLEAMACGCAVISTDCDTGPRDIIRQDVDGLLVPVGDVAALANALASLMGDELRRERMGARARVVHERFAPASILGRWTDLLQECASPGSGAKALT